MPVENIGEGLAVDVVGVVDMSLPVAELWTVGVVTCVNLLVEEIGGVAENFVEVVAVLVDMLVLVEEVRLNDVVDEGVGMLVKKLSAVVKDCVVMFVVLKEFWTVVFLVNGVVMTVENNCEGIPEEIVVGAVDILLPVGELWTFGVVTCCVDVLVKEMGGVAEIFVEVVAVFVDMIIFGEEMRPNDVVVGGVGLLVEKSGEDVPVDIVVGVVDMVLPMEELWTVGVETCCVKLIVDEMEGVAENIVEVVAVFVDMIIFGEEMRPNDVVVGGVGLLVEKSGEGVPADFFVDGFVDMLVKIEELCTVDVIVVIGGVAENFAELVAELVGMLVLVEKGRLNDVVVGGGVVMPAENVCEDVPVDIVVGVVDMVLPVEELWTVGVETCCVKLIVDEMEGVAENIVEVVAVVVDVLVFVEEIRLVDVVDGVVIIPVENDSEGAPVEIVFGAVDILLPVRELWTIGVVTCCVDALVKEMGGVAEIFVEVVAVFVDMIIFGEEMRPNDVVVGGVGLLVEKSGEGVPADFFVDGFVDMLVKIEELCTVDVIVVMPAENVCEDVPVDIVVGVVDMVLPVEELWTVGVETCCVNLIVDEMEVPEGIEENIVDVVKVVVDMLVLFEEIRFVCVLVGGVGMIVEKAGEGVLAEIVVEESTSMLVTVEELWTADVVLGGR
ncbi:hypothetical protein PO909_023514 [Leuciscus waleckii]